MFRKIKWTSERFIKENRIPSINQFKSKAILNNQTSDNSEKVQKAIKESLIQIEESVKSL